MNKKIGFFHMFDDTLCMFNRLWTSIGGKCNAIPLCGKSRWRSSCWVPEHPKRIYHCPLRSTQFLLGLIEPERLAGINKLSPMRNIL